MAHLGDGADLMTAPIQALLMTSSPRDPYFADVVLLSHFDGSNSSTSYTNNGSGTGIANSAGTDPALSTTQKKFGTASLHYTAAGTNKCVSSGYGGYEFGTSAYTVEFWVYLGSLLSVYVMYDGRSSGVQVSPTIYGDSTGAIYYYVNGTNVISSAASAIGTGAWHFIALSRSGGTSKLFLDGTQVGSSYTDSNNFNVSSMITIGSNYGGSAQPCNGSYIDEVRVTNGVGRYTSNFSNPTTPFPDH